MTRYEIVSRVIEEEMARPFHLGVSDCFLIGARVADALDPSRQLYIKYAGRYSTQLGAGRVLRREGCASLTDLLAQHLEPCAPARAVLGDLVVARGDGIEHVAVCLSSTRFIGKTEAGPVWRTLHDVISAFRT